MTLSHFLINTYISHINNGRNQIVPKTILIKQQQMYSEFLRILETNGFEKSPAEQCAKIFTQNSLDGIYSHGVNRFPRFVQYIKKKLIDVKAKPTQVSSGNAIEQWNGNLGPGPLNAVFCADRAMEKAKEYGIGCIAIANTNHWMRGGAYGWHVARKGFIYMAWTNTIGNMPAWGAIDQRLGNFYVFIIQSSFTIGLQGKLKKSENRTAAVIRIVEVIIFA